MTNRERIVRTLRGQPTDRAPFGLGLGFIPWGSTLARWRAETGIADLSPATCFGYDRDFLVLPLRPGPCPEFERRIISEDAEFIVGVDYRGITTRNRHDQGSMPEFLEYPIKSPADWEHYKQERLQPRLAQRLELVDAFLAANVDVDAPLQVGRFPWGLFGSPRDLLGAEALLMGFYTDAAMVQDMMETYTTLWLELWAQVAERTAIDRIHIWEDMAGRTGSLISMAMVERFMMPCYDRIARFAAARDIPLISVDSDGLTDQLVPTMLAHGVNVYEPFEVQAGNDILAYRRDYPHLGIIGGLDKNALADDAPPAAMHRELDRVAAMLNLGSGYIPGCDHLIPPNVSWQKWQTFNTELRKLLRV